MTDPTEGCPQCGTHDKHDPACTYPVDGRGSLPDLDDLMEDEGIRLSPERTERIFTDPETGAVTWRVVLGRMNGSEFDASRTVTTEFGNSIGNGDTTPDEVEVMALVLRAAADYDAAVDDPDAEAFDAWLDLSGRFPIVDGHHLESLRGNFAEVRRYAGELRTLLGDRYPSFVLAGCNY